MAQHAAPAEGLCLRYPDPLGQHAQVTHEAAAQMLLRAIQLAQHTPFTWGYIDKPNDGQLFLIFQMPQLPFPIDGLVYQDRDQRYSVPIAGGRELEVVEVKFGFIPGVDTSAFRVRRRYRLAKGGHPQLVLIHYSRGPPTPIIPSLDQPVRNYPLRQVNEPAVYVLGEKQGQKVFPGGGPGPGRVPPAVDRPGTTEMGMGYGMPGMGMPGNPQAMLAHQNNNMEALEKRALRRSTSMNTRQPAAAAARGDDDDSADESETISTRTLALTRYRRNHEFMNEVFMYAAFGNKDAVTPAPPYSIFKKEDLDEKVTKLTAEIEELKARSAARKQAALSTANDNADVSMEGPSALDGNSF
ncbi:hypothetical protein PYCCODRAFT_1439702 [Trametes coccinea BRFM310]|uniref:SWI/SNF and RSC complexes subunit Ssr4 N-terminal domain-containing protein n=1 Tax=Trametes coccinea (strain BRFM310) TaxID=1353009 RepID=A0A1Y2IBH5_TRAC3|nr:hypothetical protein PYCCODRAFT_1439702 [Trametes coccinea BRFM310]